MNHNAVPHTRTNQTPTLELARFADRQIANQGIQESFPVCIEGNTYEACPCENRKDLTWMECFTIDCTSTKDMDDAVSLSPIDGGFVLGVHIADVAAYVQPGSRIDEIAIDRGTSIYLPDRTIPMLPSALSADLCSLNPGEERNAVTVLIALDQDANVTGFDISKSTIISRIKGSYDEVNQVLSRMAAPEILAKYLQFETTLRQMDELAVKLLDARIAACAKIFDNDEPCISIGGSQIDISYKPRGRAESIIEEFMVLANRIVAEYFDANGLPTIFRSQSTNTAMAKYNVGKPGHANLALERYVHFTSPIRRIADLKTHQVLSLFLDGMDSEELVRRFGTNLIEVSELATKRSRRANYVQKACEKLCCRLYFKDHADDTYSGSVTLIGKNDRPVILVRELHVYIYGPTGCGLKVGHELSFHVDVDDEKNETIACHIRPKGQAVSDGDRPNRKHGKKSRRSTAQYHAA